MRRAGHHTKIVNGNPLVYYLYKLGNFASCLHCNFIIRFNRIHMNNRVASELYRKLSFNIVYCVVSFQQIFVGRDFSVQRYHSSSGAVVVNHKIVKAKHPFVRHYGFAYFVDKLFCRRNTEKRIYRVFCGAYSGNKNKYRNSRSADTVKVGACEFCYKRAGKDDSCRNTVA